MNMNKFLFLVVAATITVSSGGTCYVVSQTPQPAPPLELDKPLTPPVAEEEGEEKAAATPAWEKSLYKLVRRNKLFWICP